MHEAHPRLFVLMLWLVEGQPAVGTAELFRGLSENEAILGLIIFHS